MKSHTELLNALIDALYKAPLSKETHDLKMLAAEMRGQMMAEENYVTTTDTDLEDGWIVNTGVKPNCPITAIRFVDGIVEKTNDAEIWFWKAASVRSITHYKPL